MVLQATAGDFVINGSDMQVLTDGTVVDGGEPVAQLAIVNFGDPSVLDAVGSGLFTAPSGSAVEVASPEVRQGMIEASNVSTADEIISVMAALRGAESGQRVAQVYDDLMGRAEAVFGQQQ
jgi:flagellar basal-body rod protein FlgG